MKVIKTFDKKLLNNAVYDKTMKNIRKRIKKKDNKKRKRFY